MVEIFLRSLPKKFDHVVTITTIEELLSYLQSHEDKIERYEETYVENDFFLPKLLFSKDKTSGNDKESSNKRGHGEHFSHGKKGRRSEKGERSGRPSCNHNHYQNEFGEKGESYNCKSIQCYYCKKFGHKENIVD